MATRSVTIECPIWRNASATTRAPSTNENVKFAHSYDGLRIAARTTARLAIMARTLAIENRGDRMVCLRSTGKGPECDTNPSAPAGRSPAPVTFAVRAGQVSDGPGCALALSGRSFTLALSCQGQHIVSMDMRAAVMRRAATNRTRRELICKRCLVVVGTRDTAFW